MPFGAKLFENKIWSTNILTQSPSHAAESRDLVIFRPCVTQPLWPARVPRSCNVSAMASRRSSVSEESENRRYFLRHVPEKGGRLRGEGKSLRGREKGGGHGKCFLLMWLCSRADILRKPDSLTEKLPHLVYQFCLHLDKYMNYLRAIFDFITPILARL